MQADRDTTRAAGSAILHHIASLPRFEDTQPKPWQIVVPQDIVGSLDFGGIDRSLGKLCHFGGVSLAKSLRKQRVSSGGRVSSRPVVPLASIEFKFVL